ncbi:MAG TPA: class I SAM-dependent methyltransferase [Longimicrobiaceae bacterium]|nr:class I SAM-dependent methyltransferase [Longimicrobiaceae bacterium]
MTCCDHCLDSESLFNQRTARRDLKRYRRKGMRPSTRRLVEALAPQAHGATLLDIGGGVGAIQHELFDAGLESATQVDASTAYLERAEEEAGRRGHRDRVTLRHADFVDIADEVQPADIVTLDRVICCYPDVDALVRRSAEKATRAYGLVYPRERRLTKLVLMLGNAFFRLRGSAFRTYVHPPAQVDALVRDQGFSRVFDSQTLIWSVVVYRRNPPPSSGDPPSSSGDPPSSS